MLEYATIDETLACAESAQALAMGRLDALNAEFKDVSVSAIVATLSATAALAKAQALVDTLMAARFAMRSVAESKVYARLGIAQARRDAAFIAVVAALKASPAAPEELVREYDAAHRDHAAAVAECEQLCRN